MEKLVEFLQTSLIEEGIHASTFKDADILTNDHGLEVEFEGETYQLTIIKVG